MASKIDTIWKKLTEPGETYAWSVQDIRGVPTRCYDTAPDSLREIFALSAAHGDAEYLVFGEERHTYREVHDSVARLSAYLIDVHGVGPGDRVAIAMRNYPEWIISYWAIISTGAAAVGMNAWWTGPEMIYGLTDSAPKVLFCDLERFERVAADIDEMPIGVILVRGEIPDGHDEVVSFADALGDGEAPPLPTVEIVPEDDCNIFYTSGTTGFPKGAVMTHRAVITNMLNLAFWNTLVTLTMQASVEQPEEFEDKPQPAILLAVPLFHVTGCNCSLHPYSLLGARIILMYKWDPLEALKMIERENVVSFTGVPVMSREIVEHPDFADYDTSSLNALGGGGAPMQPDLVRSIDAKLSRARPATGYGLTETAGVISLNSGDFYIDNPSSVGPPLPVMESRIVDENGNDRPSGEVGELWVRGANVIRGYLNQPEATAEAITDGWFHTGDLAYIDEANFITIVDRLKDMVLRGGENIYCAEVEAALFDHPAVRECAVFAVPDDRLGEVPGVAIVLKDDKHVTAAELITHAREKIAAFKVPELIWFLDDELPRNANGKFLKRELRAQLVDGGVTTERLDV